MGNLPIWTGEVRCCSSQRGARGRPSGMASWGPAHGGRGPAGDRPFRLDPAWAPRFRFFS